MKAISVDIEGLKEKIGLVLERNRIVVDRPTPSGLRTCLYHAPSLRHASPSRRDRRRRVLARLRPFLKRPHLPKYPHQWFWDSCAHAIVLAHFDPSLARQELESLLSAQEAGGFIPHMIWNPRRMGWVDRFLRWFYSSPYGSRYLQPPALAEAVEEVYRKGGDTVFLARVLPAIKRYYHYLHRERGGEEEGLLSIISSYESGMDRSPQYDRAYGQSNATPVWRGPMMKLMLSHRRLGWKLDSSPFQVQDILFNCIYVVNLWSLARLCRRLQDGEAEAFEKRAQKGEEAILSRLYSPEEGLFFSRDRKRGQLLAIPTVACFVPLLLDSPDGEVVERLVKRLASPEEFWLTYPVPAQSLGNCRGKGEYGVIWRGLQTWIYPNWYIARGLRHQAHRLGREEYRLLADDLTLKSYELVMKEGLREFYHSLTGQGDGAAEFSWSGLVLDMIARMKEGGP